MTIVEKFNYEEVIGFKFGHLPIGKPRLFSHIYFIDGLLIDTGHSKMRKKIFLKTKDLSVEQLFITHHHEDHTGNITGFQKKFNCNVYASALCCEIMKKPPKISFAQRFVWGNREAQFNLRPVNNLIETKKFQFQIIPIPGHALDMVALYEPQKKWLFSADLYINSYISYFLKNENISLQIQSIKSILKLDFKVLFCSHYPELVNGKKKLTEKLHFLESFFENVSKLYLKGYTAKEIFRQLQLKENYFIKYLSNGSLSKMNMVQSVIRNLN